MEILSPGIAVFKDIFLRSEELIEMSEESTKWRPGTAGKGTDPKIRITDIHDMDPNTELHGEALQAFLDGINEYRIRYPHCRVQGGEHLRVARYGVGGHYAPHTDSAASERILSGVLFLNGDFEGGELKFEEQDLIVKPEEGMLVLFPSNYIFPHSSLPITEGSKHAIISWFK